jgi:hypothetical protein
VWSGTPRVPGSPSGGPSEADHAESPRRDVRSSVVSSTGTVAHKAEGHLEEPLVRDAGEECCATDPLETRSRLPLGGAPPCRTAHGMREAGCAVARIEQRRATRQHHHALRAALPRHPTSRGTPRPALRRPPRPALRRPLRAGTSGPALTNRSSKILDRRAEPPTNPAVRVQWRPSEPKAPTPGTPTSTSKTTSTRISKTTQGRRPRTRPTESLLEDPNDLKARSRRVLLDGSVPTRRTRTSAYPPGSRGGLRSTSGARAESPESRLGSSQLSFRRLALVRFPWRTSRSGSRIETWPPCIP